MTRHHQAFTVELDHQPMHVWQLIADPMRPQRWNPFYDARRLACDNRPDPPGGLRFFPSAPAHAWADAPLTHRPRDCDAQAMRLRYEMDCRLGTLAFALEVHAGGGRTFLHVAATGDAVPANVLSAACEAIAQNVRLVCKLRHPLRARLDDNAPRTAPPTVRSRYPRMTVHPIERRTMAQAGDGAFQDAMAQRRPLIVADYGAHQPANDRLKSLAWWADEFGPQSTQFHVFGAYAYEAAERGHTDLATFVAALQDNPNRLRAAIYEFPSRRVIGLNRHLCLPGLVPDVSLVDGSQIWIGAGHLKSPMHQDGRCVDRTGCDPEKLHNLNWQVLGRKHWVLAHPDQTPHVYPHALSHSPDQFPRTEVDWFSGLDEAKHPGALQAELHECVLEEGELLYVPRGWWHQVYSLGTSINHNTFFRSPDF